jgi:hypothetical protein
MDTAKTLMAERQKCWQKTFELRRIYTPVVLRAQTDLDPQFRDVIASIRVEVGLDESKEAFLTATAHDANRFEGQLASMGAAIDTMAQSETQEDTPPK